MFANCFIFSTFLDFRILPVIVRYRTIFLKRSTQCLVFLRYTQRSKVQNFGLFGLELKLLQVDKLIWYILFFSFWHQITNNVSFPGKKTSLKEFCFFTNNWSFKSRHLCLSDISQPLSAFVWKKSKMSKVTTWTSLLNICCWVVMSHRQKFGFLEF